MKPLPNARKDAKIFARPFYGYYKNASTPYTTIRQYLLFVLSDIESLLHGNTEDLSLFFEAIIMSIKTAIIRGEGVNEELKTSVFEQTAKYLAQVISEEALYLYCLPQEILQSAPFTAVLQKQGIRLTPSSMKELYANSCFSSELPTFIQSKMSKRANHSTEVEPTYSDFIKFVSSKYKLSDHVDMPIPWLSPFITPEPPCLTAIDSTTSTTTLSNPIDSSLHLPSLPQLPSLPPILNMSEQLNQQPSQVVPPPPLPLPPLPQAMLEWLRQQQPQVFFAPPRPTSNKRTHDGTLTLSEPPQKRRETETQANDMSLQQSSSLLSLLSSTAQLFSSGTPLTSITAMPPPPQPK